MVEFCLKLGKISRKLILPLIASILYIVMDLIEYFTEMPELHFSLDVYTRGISYTAIIIIPLFQKRFSKIKRENEEKFQFNKRTLFHFSLLYINYIVFFVVYSYLYILKNDDPDNTEDYKLSHYYGLCSEEALEIIFIVIISIFLLKMKLYIHHYIGLILFIILSLCIDIPFNKSLLKPGAFFSFLSFIRFYVYDI